MPLHNYIDPPIAGVTVNSYSSPHPNKLGKNQELIGVTVSGSNCHVIQFAARCVYRTIGEGPTRTIKISDQWVKGNTGGKKSPRLSSLANLEFVVDAGPPSIPFYEHTGFHHRDPGGKWLRIYDCPSMGGTKSNYALKLYRAADFTVFVAIDFCLADGGLLGVLRWERTKTLELGSWYTVYRVLDMPELVEWGRKILAEQGYDHSALCLPNQTIREQPITGCLQQ